MEGIVRGNVARVHRLPACDFCKETAGVERPARYDFATMFGPWAYGCRDHYETHRRFRDLGTGKAQLLVVPGEPLEAELLGG
jgi:hypothetical protein